MKVWLFSYEEVISKGTNPRLLGYYEYLKKHGHEPCFCFLKGSQDIRGKYDYKTNQNRTLSLVNLVFHFITLLLHKPCDVAYFYSPNALFTPLYLACKLRGIRMVVEKTELDSIKQVKTVKDIVNWRLYQLDEWIAPRMANALIVISSKLAFHYKKWIHKTSLIGVFTPYHSVDRPLKQDNVSSTFTIGYLGTFADKDDIDTLIKGFNYCKKHLPNAQLKLIGNAPTNRLQLLSQPNIINIRDVSNEDIHDHLLSCDVLIGIRKNNAFSHYGFPSKLAEYIATGIPVIATPTSDVPELFTDNETIKFVPHGDYQALGEAIIAVKQNPEKHAAIAQNALIWAKENWDPEVVLGRWVVGVLGD